MPRPTNHLELMWTLQDDLINLAVAQRLIDHARSSPLADQELQLQCDRRQRELDKKKAFVEDLFFEIPRSN